MNRLLLALPVALLAGCASDAGPPPPNRYEIAMSAFDAASADCQRNYPTKTATQLRRNFECIAAAENAHIRPVHPYSDLLDQKQFTRMALVSKVERRQMTGEEAAAELAKSNAEIMGEFHRRMDRDRAARAQEAAALAAIYSR